jgi:hypothetical protein
MKATTVGIDLAKNVFQITCCKQEYKSSGKETNQTQSDDSFFH